MQPMTPSMPTDSGAHWCRLTKYLSSSVLVSLVNAALCIFFGGASIWLSHAFPGDERLNVGDVREVPDPDRPLLTEGCLTAQAKQDDEQGEEGQRPEERAQGGTARGIREDPLHVDPLDDPRGRGGGRLRHGCRKR
mgnify:CR=1 FL=1